MCEDGNSRSISRRQMLRLMGAGTAGAMLGACAPRAVPPPGEAPAEEAPSGEEPVEVETEVEVAADEPEPEPTEAPAAAPQIVITLDFQGYGPSRDGVAGVALEQLLADYAALHPHVTIKHVPTDPAVWDDIQGWTEARLVAQDGPDLLFGNWTGLIEAWMGAGLVGFWDDYLATSNGYVPVNPRWQDQFILPCATESNGKTAWISLDATALGMFYNKDLFAEMGLEPPTTWPEQADVLGTVREHNKIPCGMYYGLAYAAWTFDVVANQVMHELFARMAGGERQEPTSASVAQAVIDGEYGITSPEYQDAFRIATEWWQHAPEGSANAAEDIGDVLFSLGQAATRLATVEENRGLHREMSKSPSPFEWGAWSIPVIANDLSEFATGKPPIAVFPEGFLHYIIPAYNSGQKLDQTADFMMFLSAPENLGTLVGEYKGLIANIENTPMPAGLESLRIDEDGTYWHINSLGSTHINTEMRDLWVRNWRSVLLGEMSADEYTGTMQLLLEEAAKAELQ